MKNLRQIPPPSPKSLSLSLSLVRAFSLSVYLVGRESSVSSPLRKFQLNYPPQGRCSSKTLVFAQVTNICSQTRVRLIALRKRLGQTISVIHDISLAAKEGNTTTVRCIAERERGT